jgi:hypothetical protein
MNFAQLSDNVKIGRFQILAFHLFSLISIKGGYYEKIKRLGGMADGGITIFFSQ